jgi:serine protease AprX
VILVRLDRAATKLLALVSALGVMGAITVTTSSAAVAASSSGPRSQAVVELSSGSAVSVPGVHVEAVLSAINVEIVDGSAAQLAALATTPGVVGVEPNLAAHLQSDSFGAGNSAGDSNGDKGSDHSAGNKDDNSTPSAPTLPTPPSGPDPAPSASTDATPPLASTDPTPPASTIAPATSPAEGVLAPSTLGGNAGSARAGHGVTVAIIDTGVSDTAALNRSSGRLVDAVDTSGLNTKGGHVKEHGTFTDGYGHGTFMASLIAGGKVAGSGDSALGVAPGATVDVVKVADAAGNTSLGAVLAGLNWVATHSDQVDVANLSLSVDAPLGRYGIDPLNFAVSLTRSSGVTVVVAAGNTPGVVGDPGFGPDSLTVGAADTTGATPSVAPFSGYDNVDGMTKPDVVAAGVNVLGAMPTDTVLSQQFPNARQADGLFRGSGTSQSTAIVSGLAALYLQTHHSAGPSEVKSAIRSAASSIAGGHHDGQGLVAIPTGHGSNDNTGDRSLNVGQWLSTAPLWGDVFSAAIFDGRRWGARRWDAGAFDTRRWGGVSWDARRWDAGAFDSRRWDADAFDSRRWDGGAFDSRRWDSRAWGSRGWGSRAWGAASWGDAS